MKKINVLLLLVVLGACAPALEPTPDINALVQGTLTARDQTAARVAPTLISPDSDSVFDNIAEVKTLLMYNSRFCPWQVVYSN